MDSNSLRKKFIDYFKENAHQEIPSASLVPSQDVDLAGTQKVLFTTAGMHPLIPFLLGETHPQGKRLVNCQKCLRTDDIDEVGDATHNTFFEMLGNWSLGDYWKKEAIDLSWSFLICNEHLNLDPYNFAVTVFGGDEDIPGDEESVEIWKSHGVERIYKLGKKDNFWGPVGESGPCGPDTEIFYWADTNTEIDPDAVPGSDPRWVEVWNNVFMEFNKTSEGKYEPLKQKNVDTGMGLERTLMVLQGKTSIYDTDLFVPVIASIKKVLETDERTQRIIADHIRSSVFLILDGVEPSNKFQGYILRRLLRRAAVKLYTQKDQLKETDFDGVVGSVLDVYEGVYGISKSSDLERITKVISEEVKRFSATLAKGLKEIEKLDSESGKEAFDLYQSYGFPWEVTEEIVEGRGLKVDRKEFEEEFKKHQEASRSANAGMFKGGLAEHSETTTKYHTATHLLHQALRDVLGPEVLQRGSNITGERLRFDFSFDRKLTDEEVSRVEEILNQRIKDSLEVEKLVLPIEEAKEKNAIGLFGEKYDREVSVYGVGPLSPLDPNSKDLRDRGGYYSLEFCGGPHVTNTSQIGGIKITKEESISQGVRRIRAVLT